MNALRNALVAAGISLTALSAHAQTGATAATPAPPASAAPPPSSNGNLAPGATGQGSGLTGSAAETQALQDSNRRSQCSEGTLPQEPNPPCKLTPDAPTNNALTPTLPPENRPAKPQ